MDFKNFVMKFFSFILLIIFSMSMLILCIFQGDEVFPLSKEGLTKELYLPVGDNTIAKAKHHIDYNYVVISLKYPLKINELISSGWKKEERNIYTYFSNKNELLTLKIDETRCNLFVTYRKTKGKLVSGQCCKLKDLKSSN